jgi:molybdenum cofactor cytidylyltransferase
MGTSKQMLAVKGTTLLEKVISVIDEIKDASTFVVLGANADDHKKYVKDSPNIQIVVNTEWKTGIGSSIKSGLGAVVKSTPDIDGVLFVVCDQPHLSSAHLKSMVHTFQTTDSVVISSGYDDTEGVPALFEKNLFSEIFMLNDNEGAKKIIEKHYSKKVAVPFDKGSIDLDTPDDFRNYLRSLDEQQK